MQTLMIEEEENRKTTIAHNKMQQLCLVLVKMSNIELIDDDFVFASEQSANRQLSILVANFFHRLKIFPFFTKEKVFVKEIPNSIISPMDCHLKWDNSCWYFFFFFFK